MHVNIKLVVVALLMVLAFQGEVAAQDTSQITRSLLPYLTTAQPLIEFTEDGTQLFVQATLANHIVVFDVDSEQMTLRRNPYVLCTGHAPSAMAISPRCER